MTAIMSGTTYLKCTGRAGVKPRERRKACTFCGKGGQHDPSVKLYMAHTADAGNGRGYCHLHGDTQWVLCEETDSYSGTLRKHECRAGASESTGPDPEESESEPERVSEPQPVAVLNGGTLAAPAPPAPLVSSAAPAVTEVAGMLTQLLANSVSPDRVNALFDQRWEERSAQDKSDLINVIGSTIRERLDDLSLPTTVRIEVPGREVRTLNNAHKALPLVLATAGAGEHVMMVGPMGTGKSTIAAHVAKALDLPFGFIAVGPQTSDSKILGYMDANGNYVGTIFRRIYEHGGIMLFDELDAGHPGVLTILNAALANGHMSFPDGMVDRHPDCLIFAAANTYGRGPDRQYVGRQAIDAATLDRFAVIEIQVDEALETQICYSTGLESVKCDQVLRYVRQLRKNAETNKMAVGFSPRASKGICAMLNAGISLDDAIEMRARRGLSDQDWSKVTAGAVKPVGVSL